MVRTCAILLPLALSGFFLAGIAYLQVFRFGAFSNVSLFDATPPIQAPTPQGAPLLGDESRTDGPLTTVVGVYIATPSKHSLGEYETWMTTYLKMVTAPLILYLANFPEERIREMRGDLPILIRQINSTWDLPHAAELREAYEGPQLKMDPEKGHHTPALYAIWNAKAGLLAEVAAVNPFHSRYFIYADVGLFRDAISEGVVPPWPAEHRVIKMFANRSNLMVFGLIGDYNNLLSNRAHTYRDATPPASYKESEWRHFVAIMGGFMGGDALAVRRYADTFYPLIKSNAAEGNFIGKDQEVYYYLAIRNFFTKEYAFVGGSECGDHWWFVTHFLAQSTKCSLKMLEAYH
jgi:hypothetical protein